MHFFPAYKTMSHTKPSAQSHVLRPKPLYSFSSQDQPLQREERKRLLGKHLICGNYINEKDTFQEGSFIFGKYLLRIVEVKYIKTFILDHDDWGLKLVNLLISCNFFYLYK